MLTICPALKLTRDKLVTFWLKRTSASPDLHKILSDVLLTPPAAQTQFILDPQMDPATHDLCKDGKLGQEMLRHVYYLTRTFAYYMHRAKMISLGRWPGDPGRKQKAMSKKLTVSITSGQLILNNVSPHCDQLFTVSVSGPPVLYQAGQPPATITAHTDSCPRIALCHDQPRKSTPGSVTTTHNLLKKPVNTITSSAGVVSGNVPQLEKNGAVGLHKPDAVHGLGCLGGAGSVCVDGGGMIEGSTVNPLSSSPLTSIP